MKNNIILLSIFLLIGCSCNVLNIEEKHYIKEKNISSYNIFYQFYHEDGNLYRIKILKNTESNSNEPCSRYPDRYPYRDYKKNPNEIITKILLVDLDSKILLKRIEGEELKNIYRYYRNDSVYGEKVKYYIFEITDDLLENYK